MAAVIECRGLTKQYRGATALARSSVSSGPAGPGKTTTLRILLGLVTPTAGHAWLNGRQVPGPAGLAHVGAMIEEPTFYPWLTGRRNLEVLALPGPALPGPSTGEPGRLHPRPTGPGPPPRRGGPQGQGVLAGHAAAARAGGSADVQASATAARRACQRHGPGRHQGVPHPAARPGRRRATVFLSSHLLAEVEQVCDEVGSFMPGG